MIAYQIFHHIRYESTLNCFVGIDNMEMNIYGSCGVLGYRWHTLCREFTFKGSFTSSSDVATTTSGQKYSLHHSGIRLNSCKACL